MMVDFVSPSQCSLCHWLPPNWVLVGWVALLLVALGLPHLQARLLVGLYQPTRGQVQFDGQDAHAAFAGRDALVLRRRIQMIFQDPYASLNPRWSVGDVVAEPLLEHGLAPSRTAAQDAVVGLAAIGGFGRGRFGQVPAPVFGWAAPAHLNRPRPGHRARVFGV